MGDSSPFSFHCMICIEEFDADARYPVVLPCGHTYVCAECAHRLDKCMECRTPLFSALTNDENRAPITAAPSPPHLPPLTEYERRLQQRGRSDCVSRSGAIGRRRPPPRTSGAGPGAPPSTPPRPVPAAPPPKQRLPLPKNAVLLSLMEATEIASEGAKRSSVGGGSGASGLASSPTKAASSGAGYGAASEEALEEEKIRLGTSVASGTSGTYIVSAAGGLLIVSERPPPGGTAESAGVGSSGASAATGEASAGRDPSSPPHSPIKKNDSFGSNGSDTCLAQVSPKENVVPMVRTPSKTGTDVMVKVDSMVSDYRNHELEHSPYRRVGSSDDEEERGRSKSPDGLRLLHGDRVQVVSMDGGWAKLARGYGFVHCPKGTELIKVGGSMDKACHFEAMLQTLAHRRNDLKREQARIDQMTVRLMKDFQAALHEHDDLTVVVGSAFNKTPSPNQDLKSQMKDLAAANTIAEERDSPSVEEVARASSNDTGDQRLYNPQKPQQQPDNLEKTIQMTRADSGVIQDQNRGLSCFARGALSRLYGGRGDKDDDGDGRSQQARGGSDSPPAIRSVPSHPPPSHITAGAREWRRRNGKAEARGTHIDFRTGLSGHTGLTVAPHACYSAHPHDFIDGSPPSRDGEGRGGSAGGEGGTGGRRRTPVRPIAPRTNLRMSSHSGLTVKRGWSSKNKSSGVVVSSFAPAVVSNLYSSLSASLDRGDAQGEQEKVPRTP